MKTIEQILDEKKDLVINPDWTGCKPTEEDVKEYSLGSTQG